MSVFSLCLEIKQLSLLHGKCNNHFLTICFAQDMILGSLHKGFQSNLKQLLRYAISTSFEPQDLTLPNVHCWVNANHS